MTVTLMAMTRNGLAETRDIRKEYIAPEIFTFPGGEHHLRNIPEFNEEVTWVALVRGSDPNDLVKAALLGDVAKQRGDRFNLLLPYLPAARADRGVPLGAEVYADFINAVYADRVVAIDPHSSVMGPFISDFFETELAHLLEYIVNDDQFDGIIAPDKGAVDRAGHIANWFGLDLYQAHKKRDFATGVIDGIEMVDHLPRSGRYLVVDDICDGGGTFMGLAGATELPREQLSLWVTHGIFSGNANLLREKYGHVYTTDSHPGARRIDVNATIIPTLPHLLQYVERP